MFNPVPPTDGPRLLDHRHGGFAYPPINDAAVERAAGLLRAAGEPGRFRLLVRLLEGEMCVTELAEESGDEISLVSQRLRTLRAEKLVTRRREGKHIYYGLSDSHVAALVKTTLAHAQEDNTHLQHESES